MELQCPTPAQCMDFARTTCGGDFELVMDDSYAGYKGGTHELVLVQCKRAAPLDGQAMARDAGP